MRVDFARLEAMRRAWQTARATSTGLAHEIIRVEQERTRRYGNLRGLEMQAQAYGEVPRRPGEDEADFAERRNAAENARAERRRQVRTAFKDFPEQMGAALAEIDRVGPEDAGHAIAEAEQALARIDQEIAELRAEQGFWGNRSGALKQSIEAAELWLAQHPEALCEDVPDEEQAA
jgi:hypothetical protein